MLKFVSQVAGGNSTPLIQVTTRGRGHCHTACTSLLTQAAELLTLLSRAGPPAPVSFVFVFVFLQFVVCFAVVVCVFLVCCCCFFFCFLFFALFRVFDVGVSRRISSKVLVS